MSECPRGELEDEHIRVESEIERLLLHAEVDGAEDPKDGQHIATPNISGGCQSQCCVDQIFSGYLGAISTHQQDTQDFISDAFETLNIVTESLKETCSADGESTICCDIANNKQITIESDHRDGVISVSENEDHPSKDGFELVDVDVPRQVIIEGNCSTQTSRETICIQHSTTNSFYRAKFESDQVSIELSCDEASKELQDCEENLRKEHETKELQLTLEIEQAGRIVAEYEAMQIERAMMQERLQHAAATNIQAYWRGHSVRSNYYKKLRSLKEQRLQRRHKAALLLQARWRGLATRKVYLPLLEIHRALKEKEAAILKFRSATKIQAAWKGYSARSVYAPVLSDLKHKRIFKTKKKEEENAKMLNLNASAIQARWRGQLVRRVYAPVLKQWMKRWKEEKQKARNMAAIKIQAQWRGFSERKKTKLWLEEHRVFIKHNNAAIVLQAYWKMHTCRKVFLQQRKDNNLHYSCNSSHTTFETTFKDSEGRMTVKAQNSQQLELKEHNSESSELFPGASNWRGCKPLLQPEAWIDCVQERIKQWFSSITPWSHNKPSLKQACSHTPINRSSRAMTKVDLLQNSRVADIDDVEEGVISGSDFVPDLSSLSSCCKLCSLNLENCGLKDFTALPSNLSLLYLNLKANILEYVDLQNVGSKLKFLNIAENRLSSIHGLDTCQKLLELDISGNRITRLGGLSGCCHLQSLYADSNLLVCCDNLEVLPYLQVLSCAKNHLPCAPDVSKSSLLLSLNLQQNNLHEVPHLQNHVLLTELLLDDNNLLDISPLCNGWLPLLRILSVAQNRISHLGELVSLIMLNILDIRNNSVYDLQELQEGLNGCMELQCISIDGNPVAQEPEIRSYLISVLPSLKTVDGQALQNLTTERCLIKAEVSSTPVYSLCHKLLRERENLKKSHSLETETSKRAKMTVSEIFKNKVKHREEMEDLLIKHRIELEKLGEHCLSKEHKRSFINSGHNLPVNSWTEQGSAPETSSSQLVTAAVVLQAAWRGYMARRLLSILHHSALLIQKQWKMHREHQLYLHMRNKHNKAATVIQAAYRGYWTRQRLNEVIEKAKYSSDEDCSLEEGIDFNINMSEEDLDVFELPPTNPAYDSLQVTKNYLQQRTPEVQEQHGYIPCPSTEDFDTTNFSNASNVASSYEVVKDYSSSCTHPSSIHSFERKDSFTDEWGFKSNASVKLLMKRAERQKKFEKKAAHRKRMADPVERLAAFHKKSNLAITNPKQSHLRDDQKHPDQLKTTYRWQHEHAVFHKDVQIYSREKKKQESSSVSSASECSLPQLDRRVLAGHAPMLVAETVYYNKSSSAQDEYP